MSGRMTLGFGLAFLFLIPAGASARHGGGGGHGSLGGGGHMGLGGGHLLGNGNHHPGAGGAQLAAVGGGYAAYGLGWPYFVAGPGYFSPGYPVGFTMGPAGGFYPSGMIPPPVPMRGPLLPPPPAGQAAPVAAAPRPTPADPNRSAHLLTFGDRLFRAGNFKKAEERYTQARHASPNQAAPYLRLAQLALVRGRYAEAADRLRDAETAEPGWVLTAPDIQANYAEPTDFLRQIARLESHVQSHPDDRDAWLVLGAQWFLSGRTARAADIFTRLDDPNRQADIALTAFLFASNQARPRAGEGEGRAPMAGRAVPRRSDAGPDSK